jgi:acyl-CoA dehydrogenase
MIRDKDVLEHITQTIRSFVNDQLIPREDWVAENDRLPEDIIAQMRELGLFGLTIPEAYGLSLIHI